MKSSNLSTYLNDHFAGSVSALELVDHLIESELGGGLEVFLKDLRAQIQEDQDILKKLMERLDISENKLKSATAWAMEKAGEIALHPIGENDLALLHSMEGLMLGITGKKALWRALAVAIDSTPELKEIDFTRLEMRAGEQCQAVEVKRLEAARRILKPLPHSLPAGV